MPGSVTDITKQLNMPRSRAEVTPLKRVRSGEVKELYNSFIQKVTVETVTPCNISVFSEGKGKNWLTVTTIKQRRN